MQPTYDTPTMAELYFQQGHVNRAIETYRRIVERDPMDASAQQRLDELEMMAGLRREIPAKIAGAHPRVCSRAPGRRCMCNHGL